MAVAIARHTPPQRLINLVNPLVRGLIHSPLHRAVDDALIELHVTGRKTGRVYRIPVGYIHDGDHLLVVTQHAWARNLRGGATVQVVGRGWQRLMSADLDEDPESVARTMRGAIEHSGPRAARTFGLRMDPDSPPTLEELVETARVHRLSVVTLSEPGPR